MSADAGHHVPCDSGDSPLCCPCLRVLQGDSAGTVPIHLSGSVLHPGWRPGHTAGPSRAGMLVCFSVFLRTDVPHLNAQHAGSTPRGPFSTPPGAHRGDVTSRLAEDLEACPAPTLFPGPSGSREPSLPLMSFARAHPPSGPPARPHSVTSAASERARGPLHLAHPNPRPLLGHCAL